MRVLRTALLGGLAYGAYRAYKNRRASRANALEPPPGAL